MALNSTLAAFTSTTLAPEDCSAERTKYIEETQVDYATLFPLFAVSLLLAAFLGYSSSYFVSILFFYKQKKERIDQEVVNDLRKKALKDRHDSSSAPKKIRKQNRETNPATAVEQTYIVPGNNPSSIPAAAQPSPAETPSIPSSVPNKK